MIITLLIIRRHTQGETWTEEDDLNESEGLRQSDAEVREKRYKMREENEREGEKEDDHGQRTQPNRTNRLVVVIIECVEVSMIFAWCESGSV